MHNAGLVRISIWCSAAKCNKYNLIYAGYATKKQTKDLMGTGLTSSTTTVLQWNSQSSLYQTTVSLKNTCKYTSSENIRTLLNCQFSSRHENKYIFELLVLSWKDKHNDREVFIRFIQNTQTKRSLTFFPFSFLFFFSLVSTSYEQGKFALEGMRDNPVDI